MTGLWTGLWKSRWNTQQKGRHMFGPGSNMAPDVWAAALAPASETAEALLDYGADRVPQTAVLRK